MRTLAITLAAFAALAAGCSSDKAPQAQTQPAQTSPAGPATTSPTPTPTAPPALGQTQTQEAGEYTVRVTAFTYRQPLPADDQPTRKGYTYAGADVRVCLTKGPNGTVSWDPWHLVFADATTIEPVSSWSDEIFQVPLYPGFDRPLPRGRCVRGWIVFEVPKGKRPTGINYEPTDEYGMPVAGPQWAIR